MPRMRLVTIVLILGLVGAGALLPLQAAVPAGHAAQTVLRSQD